MPSDDPWDNWDGRPETIPIDRSDDIPSGTRVFGSEYTRDTNIPDVAELLRWKNSQNPVLFVELMNQTKAFLKKSAFRRFTDIDTAEAIQIFEIYNELVHQYNLQDNSDYALSPIDIDEWSENQSRIYQAMEQLKKPFENISPTMFNTTLSETIFVKTAEAVPVPLLSDVEYIPPKPKSFLKRWSPFGGKKTKKRRRKRRTQKNIKVYHVRTTKRSK